MLHLFETPWDDLDDDAVCEFLKTAGEEGVTWEAKADDKRGRLRIAGEIPAGGMRVPLFHDSTTDTEHALHVLWADSLRWQGFKRALETPDRPDLSDPQIGGPLARRLALEGFDEASRPI